MASTNKTDNMELNQWVKTDPVLMEDFNLDNQIIDETITQLQEIIPNIQVGSYQGKNTYGSANKNSITFSFKPKLVVITGEHNMELAILTASTTRYGGYCVLGSPDYSTFSWSGNKLSWYSADSALAQLNGSKTYRYFAIG